MHHEKKELEIKLEKGVLEANAQVAEENRSLFREKRVFALNVMSSPGSGKTTLLTKTLQALKTEFNLAVIVGDICTENDAERLRGAGDIPVIQICTEPFGGDCHLNATLVKDALSGLDLDRLEILVVENLGNLVCPAEFDLGEDRRAVVLSVTEGEDKPVKYPLMFQVSDVAVLNKIDLIPHLDFNREMAIKNIKSVNPRLPVIELSARTGEGMEKWLAWIKKEAEAKTGRA